MSDSAAKNRPPRRLISLREGRSLLIGTGFLLTLISVLLLLFPSALIQQTELRLYDVMLTANGTPKQHTSPVIVGIDEDSLESYGQWPWPRYRLAQLVKRLRELGAGVIVLDFLMPEPDRTSPDLIMAERQRDMGQGVSPTSSSAVRDTNSKQLADALTGAKAIIGYYVDFSGTVKASREKAPALPQGLVVTGSKGSDTNWPLPTGFIRSIPLLSSAAGAEGFTNAQNDMDGVLRRVPLLIKLNEIYYPSLALGAVLLGSSKRSLFLTNTSGETKLLWGASTIPLDRQGNLLLDFRGKGRPFEYFSAGAILSRGLSTESLRGRIVLVGVSAKGLGDLHLVPLGRTLNGLEIQATIVDNILSDAFISRPGWSLGAELCAVILLGFLSTWLISRPGFVLTFITGLAGTLSCYWGGKELLIARGLFISPFLPMMTLVMITTALSLLKYGIEAHKLQQRTSVLLEAQDTIILSMLALTEARDKETGGHILRTQKYVQTLARQLANSSRRGELDVIAVELLAKSAPLHDIGKVGIPDAILNKRDQLSPEEFSIMKSHTLIGADALARTVSRTGHPENLDFLQYARQMIESHHERWNGSGYPRGLKGADIPLAGRLMALADVYDAITSSRVYKRAFPHQEAKRYILNESGRLFDPEVVNAFIAREEEFMHIANTFADNNRQGENH
ncbi:Metal-dependent phosphohydrolase, HD subdomain:CHASE2 [Candidatus Sulfobium mesophilum]|uniref:Metal-dependent phosphohydrolase, HD subdomain:CHASE2 n=1 Tax=Candidatus Sulfobium mesophilum TaxID=2016548 RepID=A0A2U3QF00_9BACT|nr:Metal-dependent phosphohydrolase, HD subdomain:CHASE2 [Candidatus Sulfobium mesophilum]